VTSGSPRGSARSATRTSKNWWHAATATIVVALSVSCTPTFEPTTSLIVVVIDTLRSDHLSLYGYDRQTSPRLDALANEAIVFERCLSTSPWTLPSTLSLLTGLYPGRHGVETVVGKQQVSPEVELLAERLAAHGYRTAAFSENPYVSPTYGLDQGFEHFSHSLSPAARTYRDLTVPIGKARTWLAERAEDDAPFFLYLHVMNVHGPYMSPDDYHARFLEEPSEPFEFKAPLWEDIMVRRCTECRADVTEARLNDLRARYDGAIAHTDEVLGEFFAELRRDGVLDQSVLVVTSDHGEELFDHGGFGHGKSLYGEMLNVPLLVRPPGGTTGRRIAEPVSLVDVPATLLELLSFPPAPGGIDAGDGVSLVPLMAGERAADGPARTLVAQVDAAMRARAFMIQQWPWRLIATEQDYRDRSGITELFDVERDPSERNDRAAAEPDRLQEMLAALEETRRALAADAAPEGPDATWTPDLERRLEALGYLDEAETR
jgi:arylsulfatase A-like enzyme